MGARTVVADVADELARRVATGVYAPGDLMPSVRQVAEEFGMNRATAQLVLGRLESHGLVDAHRGRGFTVRDVRRVGGLDVYRRLFRLSMPEPELAAEMFRDIVATERAIVLEALLDYTELESGADTRALHGTVDELESLARAAEPDYALLLEIEIGLVRDLLTELGHSMRRAVLNSVGEMLFEVPEAVRAIFAVSPDMHVLVWRALLAVWESGSGPSEAQLSLFEDLFGMYHEKVVARFDELVGLDAESAGSAAREAV
ncbi:GntR family transcriptional regulator [Nocardia sp. NBC_01503]|uniref:GntR family transcriptional regulator n=1 Tax=Nocardia sp. NBC_01503 TaxID=2975997 RepID=UPI002E7B62FC|nr:GntR family transcriptional regulator [Nocardia sp. NBC_01503]WTL29856.1 GntR family transcriptional regulator [Nocardia sp. NBC_01503]